MMLVGILLSILYELSEPVFIVSYSSEMLLLPKLFSALGTFFGVKMFSWHWAFA
jgi:hypothetical protein